MPLADTSNAQIELGLINGSWNYSNLRWEGANTINDVSFNYGGNGNPTCESIYSVISSFPLITSSSQNIISTPNLIADSSFSFLPIGPSNNIQDLDESLIPILYGPPWIDGSSVEQCKTDNINWSELVDIKSRAPTPPTNLGYKLINKKDSDTSYNIFITWDDEFASEQAIELMRGDSQLVMRIGPPDPETTEGWLIMNNIYDSSGNITSYYNPFTVGLEWDKDYTFLLRTVFLHVPSSSSIFSSWVGLKVFQENEALRRLRDRCTVETLDSLENRLESNLAGVPNAYRFSRIVRGGNKMTICQTWRPPTWKKIRQNYPILVAQEEAAILKNTPGNPEYDKAQAAAKQAQDEINTSNNPQTAIDEWQSNQLFPCGSGPRRTGSRLPFSLYYF